MNESLLEDENCRHSKIFYVGIFSEIIPKVKTTTIFIFGKNTEKYRKKTTLNPEF